MADATIPNADRPAFPTEYSPQMTALRGLTKKELFRLVLGAGYLAAHADQTVLLPKTSVFVAEVTEYADALLASCGEPTP